MKKINIKYEKPKRIAGVCVNQIRNVINEIKKNIF